MNARCIADLLACSVLACAPLFAQDGQARTILFVRGADGTGGFLEGGADEQLSDIADASTAFGNHGWASLRASLEAEGFVCAQVTEAPGGNGVPVDLASLDLAQVAVLVLASNNATYSSASVDAVELFVKSGGGLLCISDANWGQDWGDAPASDQPFLDRFGLVMNQDNDVYSVSRALGDFVIGGVDHGLHPILAGPDGVLGTGDDVNEFDGEGVSPLTVAVRLPGVRARVLAKAKGTIHVNDSASSGSFRAPTDADGSLVVADAFAGRVAGHFDRNTFFNLDGAGTSLFRFDNQRYALNLFLWLAGPMVTPYGEGKLNSHGLVAELASTAWPTSGADLPVDVADAIPSSLAIAFTSSGYDATPFLGGLRLVQPPLVRLPGFITDGNGNGSYALPLAQQPAGSTVYTQLWYRDPFDPAGFTIGLSRALRVQVGN